MLKLDNCCAKAEGSSMEVVDRKLWQGGLRIHSEGFGMLGKVFIFCSTEGSSTCDLRGWIWPINVFYLACPVF